MLPQVGDRDLLEDVSWRLMPGSRVGLVGANGAGKSTLLRCLTGVRQVSKHPTSFSATVHTPAPRAPTATAASHPSCACNVRQVDAGRMVVAHKVEMGYLEQTAVSGSTRTVWDEARSRMTDLLEAEAMLDAAGAAMEAGEHRRNRAWA